MVDADSYVHKADDAVLETQEKPLSIQEYVDKLFENPSIGAHSAKYILDAIESVGTRTVIEEGEECTRWKFFDNPHNEGKHAILGNTKTLNNFVEDIRTIASGQGKDEKIVWVSGPTATGKSELKRCLVDGLKAYSKTDAGRRYTIEWNIESRGSNSGTNRGLSYGNTSVNEDDWYRSPVQAHPLSVFPEDVRTELVADLNSRIGNDIPILFDCDLDPFSREAYEFLSSYYRDTGSESPFSEIVDPKHLRVVNYIVDIGQGIGVLHTEDDGSVKERLVGSWMPGMFSELESRGRKNPQAFSYDGVVSQGNGLLTIVEDAGQHTKLLTKLLNVPDEKHVKLDKATGMDVDTLLLAISNPDLESVLRKSEQQGQSDSLRAIRRRLDKNEFRYLTNISLESQLLLREVVDKTNIWDVGTYDEIVSKMREGVMVDVPDGDNGVRTRELAPHAIEAASMYNVITRLVEDDSVLDLQEKAVLFDQGYLEDIAGEIYEIEDFDFRGEDGQSGIPVTYTRDVIAKLLQNESDRVHKELDVGSVLMPQDIISEMASSLENAPIFNDNELIKYDSRLQKAEEYVFEKQRDDVLDAVLADEKISDETVTEYIKHVYAYVTDQKVSGEYGPEEPDPFVMKVFETEHLNKFDASDYHDLDGSSEVEEFRQDQIVAPINRRTWERRDESFNLDSIDFWDIPVIHEQLHDYDWDDVENTFDNFDINQWDDPPENTETAEIKEKTLAHMVSEQGYTEASAELTSRKVMSEVA